jgi:hypothetical protein
MGQNGSQLLADMEKNTNCALLLLCDLAYNEISHSQQFAHLRPISPYISLLCPLPALKRNAKKNSLGV